MITKWWLICKTETKDSLEKQTEKVKVLMRKPIWVLFGENTDDMLERNGSVMKKQLISNEGRDKTRDSRQKK